ncbi:flavin prenyltransferase UbiX [Dissulfurispira thermophila]|uniref:Flavin prenyltransferase UbiX n=2 Tax=root TaxID=1 RepID=A0A7G1H5Z1_9BACT|nr:flavin prenyltransferase UbiX [Dissulfurispira thermophila]BCB97336.1 flavin prenyltransferase UbiX [Dissulfurispira thermophila]
MKKYILAITGASGSIFGVRLLEELLKVAEVHLAISANTFPIIKDETGIDWTKGKRSGVKDQRSKQKRTQDTIRKYFKTERLFFYEDKQIEAPIASGSFKTDGMLVVPCSMKTLSGIANGYANNLIERAADVVIKEGRPLLLSPREMPFSAIHLENMLKLARLGVKIAPPISAFYHQPKSLDDMVNFIVGKILDVFGVQHSLFKRWGN